MLWKCFRIFAIVIEGFVKSKMYRLKVCSLKWNRIFQNIQPNRLSNLIHSFVQQYNLFSTKAQISLRLSYLNSQNLKVDGKKEAEALLCEPLRRPPRWPFWQGAEAEVWLHFSSWQGWPREIFANVRLLLVDFCTIFGKFCTSQADWVGERWHNVVYHWPHCSVFCHI